MPYIEPNSPKFKVIGATEDDLNSGLKNLRGLRTISGLTRKEESQSKTKLPAIASA